MKAVNKGFTLIEMMITVAIIAILAAIAVPSYIDYVRRGAIPEGLAELSNQKVRMEQFFQDTLGYQARCNQINTGTPPGIQAGRFMITCTAAVNPDPTTTPPQPGSFTLQAAGAGIVAGFTYTVTNTNVKATTGTGVWSRTNTGCWVLKKDGSC